MQPVGVYFVCCFLCPVNIIRAHSEWAAGIAGIILILDREDKAAEFISLMVVCCAESSVFE